MRLSAAVRGEEGRVEPASSARVTPPAPELPAPARVGSLRMTGFPPHWAPTSTLAPSFFPQLAYRRHGKHRIVLIVGKELNYTEVFGCLFFFFPLIFWSPLAFPRAEFLIPICLGHRWT